jgi:hypothetical protein
LDRSAQRSVSAHPATGDLGEIQRCDDCKTLPDDQAASAAARAAGFTVDDECQVIGYPPGFSIDAWRQGLWPAPEPDVDRG